MEIVWVLIEIYDLVENGHNFSRELDYKRGSGVVTKT
jgi:hypothetical protein